MSAEAQDIHTPREAPDVAARPVLFTVLGFLAFVAVSLVALRIYYGWIIRGPVATSPRPFASPQLQADPLADLKRFQRAKGEQLTIYAWVDRSKGLIRIPIDRAMELIAARGAEAYRPFGPPAEPSPIYSPETQR